MNVGTFLLTHELSPSGQTFRNLLHVRGHEVKYAYVRDPDAPWEGNHSNLVTRPQDFSDAQRWRVGPEEFHNGKVNRAAACEAGRL